MGKIELDFLDERDILGSGMLNVLKKYGTTASGTDLVRLSLDEDLGEMRYFYACSMIAGRRHFSSYCSNGDFSDIGNAMMLSAIRPVLKLGDSFLKLFANEIKSGTDQVKFGEYPQDAPKVHVQKKLEKLYINGTLKKTGRAYTLNYKSDDSDINTFYPIVYDEYEYDGKKYVRFPCSFRFKSGVRASNDRIYYEGDYVWLLVSPIEWLIDVSSKKLISKKLLSYGRVIVPYAFGLSEDVFSKYLTEHVQKYMLDDIMQSVQIVDKNKKIQDTVDEIKAMLDFYSGKEEIMERVYALIDKYNSDLKKSFNNKNQGISLSLDNVDADYLYKKLLCDLEEIYIEVNLLRGKYKEPVKMLEYTRDCIEALGSNEDVEITDDLIGDILLLKKNILPFLDDDDMILELKNIFYRWEKRLVSYIMGEKDTFLEKITDVDSFKLSIRKELMGYLSDLNTKIRNKNIVKEVKDGYVNLALGVFHKEKDDFINNFLDEIKMLILEIREKGNDNEIGEMEKILNKEIKLDDNVNNSLTVITNLYVSLYKILLEINEREERLMKLDDYTISISRGK